MTCQLCLYLNLKKTGMSAPRGRRMSSACATNNGIGHKSKERSNLGIVLDKYPNSGSTIFP